MKPDDFTADGAVREDSPAWQQLTAAVQKILGEETTLLLMPDLREAAENLFQETPILQRHMDERREAGELDYTLAPAVGVLVSMYLFRAFKRNGIEYSQHKKSPGWRILNEFIKRLQIPCNPYHCFTS